MNASKGNIYSGKPIENRVVSCLIPSFWLKKVTREFQEVGCKFCLMEGYALRFFRIPPQKAFEAKEGQSAKAQMRLIWVWSQRPSTAV